MMKLAPRSGAKFSVMRGMAQLTFFFIEVTCSVHKNLLCRYFSRDLAQQTFGQIQGPADLQYVAMCHFKPVKSVK